MIFLFLGLVSLVGLALGYIFRKEIAQILASTDSTDDEEEDSIPLLPTLVQLSPVKTAENSVLRMTDIPWSNKLTIFVNGDSLQLTNPDPSELLATFIREKVGLKGTKLGCEEGGCGACTVVLTKPEGVVSVNSCLRPLCANDGMAVTTVEGVGSLSTGLSPEQKSIVSSNGTQCGYCTPGWITNMHAMNTSNDLNGVTVTKRQIDAYLDGNICRCTGYRPILQAFQSFADSGGDENVHPCVKYNCSAEKQAKCQSNGHDVHNCSGGDVEDAGCLSHRPSSTGVLAGQHAQSTCCTNPSSTSNGGANACGTACGTASTAGKVKVVPGIARSDARRRAERDLRLVRQYHETATQPLMFYNETTGLRWIRPVNLPQLCAVLRDVASTPEAAQLVQLVGGNTSIGVTKYLNGTGPYNVSDRYNTLVDVNKVEIMCVQEYKEYTRELTVGAANSISTFIALLNEHAPKNRDHTTGNADHTVGVSESAMGTAVDHHSVFSVTANHLAKIANTQVRNAGSWAGNLMIFLRYPSFPSDAVLALATANATLILCDSRTGSVCDMSMQTFLTYSYEAFKQENLMILAVRVREAGVRFDATSSSFSSSSSRPVASSYITPIATPDYSHVMCADAVTPTSGYHLRREFLSETFKVAQRTRNAHAHVNAGFQFEISSRLFGSETTQSSAYYATEPPVVLAARIVYGGVSERTFIATQTQQVLENSPITSQTLQRALVALQADLDAVGPSTSALGSQSFRESVMQSTLYRALLRCYPVISLPESVASAVQPWVLPVSRGVEVFLPPHGPDNRRSTNPVGKAMHKLEAPIQTTGEATYPSDETMPSQGLFGAIVFSTQCAKTLVALECSAALSLPGVVAVLTAADIPGTNTCSGSPFLFVPVGEVVECVGAQLAVVVAQSEAVANQAAALVKVTYDGSSTGNMLPITNISQAVDQKSFYPGGHALDIAQGEDIDSALQSSTFVAKGRISAGGQYHFYMEAQTAIATGVDGDSITVTCGNQNPQLYQQMISAILGMPQNKVVVKCPRAGGGFGGKLSRGVPVSCAAALCANKLGKPVRIFNTRTADMAQQSGREGWLADYEVGYSADGTITALKYQFYVDAGIDQQDTLGSVYMGMNWADNAYFFPNYAAQAQLCYTNTPARTSMRAPGVVQTCLCTEMVIERVAVECGLDVLSVQQRNFIQNGETAICGQVISDSTLPTVWNTLLQRARYAQRWSHANEYNAKTLWRKRGIAICPVKYGMGWAGYNAGVQLGVNQVDGTVTVHHNGAEIGQGINTKAAQAVAYALGIDIKLIRVGSSDSDRIVNGGPTGGSGTSEVVVKAALNACAKLNDRLAPYRKIAASTAAAAGARGGGVTTPSTNTQQWIDLLASVSPDVSLNTEGWFSPAENPNQQPFQYFVYAACVTELELDVLSGEVHVLASEIVYDCGQSLNPSVDIGQIEGALVMGLGYFLTERVEYDTASGQLLTNGTWEYKPPLAQDIPGTLNVTLLKNQFNESGILGSKAVGEPPYVVANSVYFALKMAIASARKDAGVTGHFDLEVPATIELRQQASLVRPERFVMPF